jgi:hypothetical protein
VRGNTVPPAGLGLLGPRTVPGCSARISRRGDREHGDGDTIELAVLSVMDGSIKPTKYIGSSI